MVLKPAKKKASGVKWPI